MIAAPDPIAQTGWVTVTELKLSYHSGYIYIYTHTNSEGVFPLC